MWSSGFLKTPLEESPLTVRGLGIASATGWGASSPGNAKLTFRFFFKVPAIDDRFRSFESWLSATSGLEGLLEEPGEAIECRKL
jgi:hypothetical protein